MSLFFAIPVSYLVSFFLTHLMPGHFLDDESRIQNQVTDQYSSDFFYSAFKYIQGDWGNSWIYPDQSVIDFISQSLLFTLGFQLVAILFVILCSILISYLMIVSSTARAFLDKVLYLGTTLPLLFLLPVLIYYFSFKTNLLPLRYDSTWKSLLLPLIGIAFRPLCLSSQILYKKWSQSIHEDYFRTALAKGLSFSESLWRHGFKNSALTYTTQIVQFMGQILTGSVLIETLFSLPGLGFLFVESLKNRDLPLLTGLVFVFCCLYLFTQILLDGAYRYFEPRSSSK